MLLDIIIPSYRNMSGLVNTLNMIGGQYLTEVAVTVVDDCSGEDYSDILSQFPFVHLLSLKHNGGPGVARNEGIKNTCNPYIMFIDCGDYLMKKEYLGMIIDTIKNNPDKVFFSWLHNIENEEGEQMTSEQDCNRIHGRVFQRTFLEKIHARFSVEGSRANEDIGFMHIVRFMIEVINPNLAYTNNTPIVLYTYDPKSITRKDRYKFTDELSRTGIVINAIHTFTVLKENPVSEEVLKRYVYRMFGSVGMCFYMACLEKPYVIEFSWQTLKEYYIYFKTYLDNIDEAYFDVVLAPIRVKTQKHFNNMIIPFQINYKRLLYEIQTQDHTPERYIFDF